MISSGRTVFTVTIVVWVTLFVLSLATSIFAGGPWQYAGIIILALLLMYGFFSFMSVDSIEIGAVTFFGAPIRQVGPGPQIVPLFLFELLVIPKSAIQLELPGELSDEKYYRENLFKGEPGPHKIVLASPETATMTDEERVKYANDPLNKRQVANAVYIIRYKVTEILNFISEIGSIEAANRQIEDSVIATGQTVLSRYTAAMAQTSRPEIDAEIIAKVIELTKNWGIKVENVNLKVLALSDDVVGAMNNFAAADNRKAAVIREAEGLAEKTRLGLQAQADGELAISINRAKGELAMLEAQADGKKANGQAEANNELAMYAARTEGVEKLAKAASKKNGMNVLQVQQNRTALENSEYSLLIAPDVDTALAKTAAIFRPELLRKKPPTTTSGTGTPPPST